jgi:ribosomal protein L7/L12
MAGKLAGLGPQQAKELVADAPVIVLEGVSRAKAEAAKNLLAGHGAAVEIW